LAAAVAAAGVPPAASGIAREVEAAAEAAPILLGCLLQPSGPARWLGRTLLQQEEAEEVEKTH